MSLDEIGAINQNGRDDEIVIIRDVTPYICQKLNLLHHKRWPSVKDVELNVEQYYRQEKE
jgi:hypothetical protein